MSGDGGLGTRYSVQCFGQGVGQPQGVSKVPARGALSGDTIGNQVGRFDLQHQGPIAGDMETLPPRHFDTTTTTKQVQNSRGSEWYTVRYLYSTHFIDKAVPTMVSMASMSRSHHRCKLAKLLTIYFRSCGLSAKAFDTLHSLGITMSQKWVYGGIDALAQQQHVLLLEDIKRYLWFGVHDNINILFRAFQQWIGNQNHFDSGTAVTILVLKSPRAHWPDRDL